MIVSAIILAVADDGFQLDPLAGGEDAGLLVLDRRMVRCGRILFTGPASDLYL
jgi:hypothetical protein